MTDSTKAVCPLCCETGHQYGKTCPALQKNDDAVKALLATRKVLRDITDPTLPDDAILAAGDRAEKILQWPASPLP